ncbi:F0F1 ATP synthase subunit A [Paenactinomyces guangxiensis]|uniref:ATP synthase subunit a n=1 Tax=Paenactinomyces guangxiensis TaxID=1490290 RepID=A0A7W1WTV2_9BACL|nr:F0F1 ATP synthase subunit A [Paenactinomyces guangxiensis]MBA4495955.1 F0F1 ATP synthase subunit A [Paenactinomyces guangxiensis]MBH8593058.1 F0F1 ATP synthase subunit A [Paenactinomyces guangxiensis]
MELTPKVEFLGLTFDLTVIIGSLLTAVIVLLITIAATRGRKMVPTGLQNLVEMIIDFSRGMARMSFDDKTTEKFLGFTFTLFLFIFVANQLGVIMMVSAEAEHPIPALGITEEAMKEGNTRDVAWLKSPTADMNVTFAMAIAIALFANYMGIRAGIKKYLGHFFSPLGLLHVIEEFAKPATHAMRLWANIFAGEVLILIMLTKGPIWLTGAPLLLWMGFSLFVGTIQAYIFTVLANVYIGQKMASH